MKHLSFLLFIFLMLMLTACRAEAFTADTLPWVGDEPVLFKDSFTSQTGGWSTHDDVLSFSGYTQGGFRLWANVPQFQFWSVPGLNFKDTLIYTSATKLNGPDDNLFGVLCRYQDELNFYALVIGSDGYFGIYKMLAGEQALIGQETMVFSESINRGAALNEIKAVCQGDQLVLTVNGTRLIQAQDDSLAFGDVGLIVGNFSEPGVDVLFDNFIVVKPPSE
jgi:hypothetical protein